jgi:hypothetical protein
MDLGHMLPSWNNRALLSGFLRQEATIIALNDDYVRPSALAMSHIGLYNT